MKNELAARVLQLVQESKSDPAIGELAAQWRDVLPILGELLLSDQSIDHVERVENVLKGVLAHLFRGPVIGQDAREIAAFQKRLSLLLKYKSYGVKAASPLGYSVFLLSPGEGFSFQRHITHKLEVFHVLERAPGGFVFMCEFDDWKENFNARALGEWLKGSKDDFLDRHTFLPEPGDVFIISKLGLVHTALGCTLEEYATVSTDMVDRLHDQNAGRVVPKFERASVEAALARLELPRNNRLIDPDGWKITPLEQSPVDGGYRVVLVDSFVRACTYHIEAHAMGPLQMDKARVTQLRIYSGSGAIFIADEGEVGNLEKFKLEIGQGDILLVPPGIFYRIGNASPVPLNYAEHQIEAQTAFPEFF